MPPLLSGTPPFYAELTGPAWDRVAPAIRLMHGDGTPVERSGTFRVEAAQRRMGRLLARCLRLPAPAESVPVKLTITPSRNGEVWLRDFNGRRLRSTQRRDRHGRLAEKFAGMEITLHVVEQDGAIVYCHERTALAAGPFRIPLPRRLAPKVTARETARGDGVVLVEAKITLPWLGLLIAYHGEIHL